MPREAFVDEQRGVTHLTLVGVSAQVTFCGELAREFGRALPFDQTRWLEPMKMWCATCLARYTHAAADDGGAAGCVQSTTRAPARQGTDTRLAPGG